MWGKVFKTNRSYNILILGLANAGKTTLLYQMYAVLDAGRWGRQWRRRPPSAATSRKSLIKMSSSAPGTWGASSASAAFGRPTTRAPMRSSSCSTAPTSRARSSPRPSSSRSSSTRYPFPHAEPEGGADPRPRQQAGREGGAELVADLQAVQSARDQGPFVAFADVFCLGGERDQ